MTKLKEVKIGTFKLKDKAGKNAIQLDLGKILGSFPDAKFLYIIKNYRENNKVNIFVKYEETDGIPQVSFDKN